MSLIELAKIYTDLVKLDEETPDHEIRAKDSISALRSKYHELLMQQMKAEGIPFADRFDAAHKAFELVISKRL